MPQPSALSNGIAETLLERLITASPRLVPYAKFPHDDIILYGGGRLGKMAYGLLKKSGYHVSHVVDQNAANLAGDFPVPVLTLEEAIRQIAKDSYIFDCVFKLEPDMAKTRFEPHGFKNIYTVYDLLYSIPTLHFTNGWPSGALSDLDRSGIVNVYSRLSDDASRAAYLVNLAWRISRDFPKVAGFELLLEDNKYWNPLTQKAFLNGSCFIDAGAYDLFFTRQAFDATYNPYPPAKVIALEPDPESFNRCKEAVHGLSRDVQKKVDVRLNALGEREGQAQFLGGGGLSSKLLSATELDQASLVRCHTVTLDGLSDVLPNIGFLKLHVEGEELPCIRGGLRCIERHRPIIVVNCSHNRDGLWQIAHTLMEHTEAYQYYFRTHAFYGEGFYFYAVPL